MGLLFLSSKQPLAMRRPARAFSWRAGCFLAPGGSVKGYSGPLIKFNIALFSSALQESAEVCCQSLLQENSMAANAAIDSALARRET